MEPTSVDEFKAAKKTKPLRLPSGKVIMVKDNRLFLMAMTQNIPLPFLDGLFNPNEEKGKKKVKSPEEREAEARFMRDKLLPGVERLTVRPHILIQPPEDRKMGPDEMLFEDLDEPDGQALILYAMGMTLKDKEDDGAAEVADLEPFPKKFVGDVDSPNGASVPDEAVGDTRR